MIVAADAALGLGEIGMTGNAIFVLGDGTAAGDA